VKLTSDPSEREMKRRTGEVIGMVAEVQGVLPTGEKVRVSAYRDLIPTLMGLRAGQSIVLTGFAEKSPYNGVRQIDATAFTVVAEPVQAQGEGDPPPEQAAKRQRTVDMALTISGPSKSCKVLQGTQEVQAIVRDASAGVNGYLPENVPVSCPTLAWHEGLHSGASPSCGGGHDGSSKTTSSMMVVRRRHDIRAQSVSERIPISSFVGFGHLWKVGDSF
jgi:hypothetical protein